MEGKLSTRGSRPARRAVASSRVTGRRTYAAAPRAAQFLHWGTFELGRRAKKNVNDPASLFHAVEHPDPNPKYEALRFTASLCGRVPAHGWGSDLYLDQYCTRCLLAVMWRAANEEEARVALLPVSRNMINRALGYRPGAVARSTDRGGANG